MSVLEDILKKLKRNTLDKTDLDERVSSFVRSIPQRVGNYFSPTTTQTIQSPVPGGDITRPSNFWTTSLAQKLADIQAHPTTQFVAGAENAFWNRIAKPYLSFLGEAVYQGGRYVFDPTFRKAVRGEPLTSEELDKLNQGRETLFLKPEQIKTRKEIAKTGGSATARAVLATLGLSKLPQALATATIAGGIGYGTAKLSGNEKPFYEAGQAFGYSPVYAGINRLTGGPQEALATSLVGEGANWLKRGLVKGAVTGIGNVLEDLVFTPVTELRKPTKGELVVDLGTGMAMSVGGEALESLLKRIDAVVSRKRPDLSPAEVRATSKNYLKDTVTGLFMGSRKAEYGPPEGLSSREKVKWYKEHPSVLRGGKLVPMDEVYKEIDKELGLPEGGPKSKDIPFGMRTKTLSEAEHKELYGGALPKTATPRPSVKSPTTLESLEVATPTNAGAAGTIPKAAGATTGGGQLENPPSEASISDQDLISKLTKALKEAKPLRGTQEELYTKARGEKLARLLRAREKMAGEKGFYEELGALKGELPKVQFESIRQEFDQASVDRLFNMIKESKNLDDWEKINAQVGLAKILGEQGGGVPTKGEIEKLYRVFGKDFTEALLSKRSLFEKLGDLAMQAYNLPRSFMAGIGDFSATLMQNALFAYRHPILTAKNFVKQLQFFASEDAFRMSQEEIASRPTYELMKKARLDITDTGPLVTQREEAFMSSLAERIPGLGRLVKATGRAYTGFLNRMRADVFDQMVESYRRSGGEISDAYLKNVGEFINIATGRGSLGKLERIAPVLGQGLFSSRKLAATVQTLNPLFYIRSHPQVRKEALLTMLSFLGGATLITELSKLAGAEVSDDPTSADFGKIKFGNTRFNLYGPYQQLAVLFARLWKGYATSSTTGRKMMLGDESNPYAPTRLDLLTRYFESKEHPTLSLILGALRGTNQIGETFDLAPEVLNRFIPMVLSDAYDLYKEHGPVGLLGVIPAALGISTQTYGSQIPVIQTTPSGKQTVKLKPVGGLAEDIVNRLRGTPESNIPKEQRAGFILAKQEEQKIANLKEQAKQALKTGKSVAETQPATYTINGREVSGLKAGDWFIYTDEDTGVVTSKRISSIEKAQRAEEKGIMDATYSITADRLKREDNVEGWISATEDYIKYLRDYKEKLDPESDKKEILSVQNKIEDLEAQVKKYKDYGGFTKGKQGTTLASIFRKAQQDLADYEKLRQSLLKTTTQPKTLSAVLAVRKSKKPKTSNLLEILAKKRAQSFSQSIPYRK